MNQVKNSDFEIFRFEDFLIGKCQFGGHTLGSNNLKKVLPCGIYFENLAYFQVIETKKNNFVNISLGSLFLLATHIRVCNQINGFYNHNFKNG